MKKILKCFKRHNNYADETLTIANASNYIQKELDENPKVILQEYKENDLIEIEDEEITLTEKGERKIETSLEDVHQAFNKWLELDDLKRIDVMLATAMCGKAEDLEPLWLIIIGPSGDGKTEQVRALRDPLEQDLPEEADTKRISEITENTLVSGMKGSDTDLAPKLEGKTILIYDFATILNLPSEAKRKVWAQLRELYDGEIGKQSGSGKDVDYKLDPAPCLIACSTPDIDNQIIQQTKLGTRELLYRTGEKDLEEVDDVLNKVLENNSKKGEMRKELQQAVRNFLEDASIENNLTVEDSVEEELMAQAKRLSIMRAQGDFNRRNELMKDVSYEIPSRLINQLKNLYICLMSLSQDYNKERALSIVEKVVESSGEPRRARVLEMLENRGKATAYKLSQRLRVSKSVVSRDLQVLWNLELLDRRTEERENGNGKRKIYSINNESNLAQILSCNSLKEEICNIIETKDSEEVPYHVIFEEVEETEETVEPVLKQMLNDGEIYEPTPGKISLM